MSWSDTYDPNDAKTIYQSMWEQLIVHDLGASVLEGCDVTEDSGANLLVDVSEGWHLNNNVILNYAGVDAWTGGGTTFAALIGALGTDENQFVIIYLDTSGVLQHVDGTPAASNHKPPDLPNPYCVPLCLLELSENQTAIQDGDIEEYRPRSPMGEAYRGDVHMWRTDEASVGTPTYESYETVYHASRYNSGTPVDGQMKIRADWTADVSTALVLEVLNASDAWIMRFNDTGRHFQLYGDYYWYSSTSFQGVLQHANSGHRAYTFQDKDYTLADHADLHSESHTLQSHAAGDLAYTQLNDIVDTVGSGTSDMLSAATHVHTGSDGSSVLGYSAISGLVDISGAGSASHISGAEHQHTDIDGSTKVAHSNLSGIGTAIHLDWTTPTASRVFDNSGSGATTAVEAVAAGGTVDRYLAQLTNKVIKSRTPTDVAGDIGSSITTVGEITVGKWYSDPVITTYGGTGLASFTAGDILHYVSGTALTRLAKGTAGQALVMNSGATAPEWGTAESTQLLQDFREAAYDIEDWTGVGNPPYMWQILGDEGDNQDQDVVYFTILVRSNDQSLGGRVYTKIVQTDPGATVTAKIVMRVYYSLDGASWSPYGSDQSSTLTTVIGSGSDENSTDLTVSIASYSGDMRRTQFMVRFLFDTDSSTSLGVDFTGEIRSLYSTL